MVPKTKEELEKLISDKVEENLQLEYKAAEALGHSEPVKKEIAKDVSAMANSAGGILIYGIKEYDDPERKHLPERITPIDRTQFSKESLEQIIGSRISPGIDGLVIYPVQLGETSETVYVLDIPQSNTAHQNVSDGRYYRRHNFESRWMQDYEVRDIMNRQKYPIIELGFRIEKETYEVKPPFPVFTMPGLPIQQTEQKQYQTDVNLKIVLLNSGAILAQYINYSFLIPNDLVHDTEAKRLESFDQKTSIFNGDNTYRDVVDIKGDALSGYSRRYGPSRYDPLLPGMRGRSRELRLIQDPRLDERELFWKVHADNAPLRTGSVKLNEIAIIEKEET